jgi:RHS repeat-associated protein
LPGDPVKLPDYTAAPGYTAKYTYDAHGNIISMPHLPLMEWDFKDQLHATQRQVDNNGAGEKTYYVYDAGGERVRKVTETQGGKLKEERIYLGGFEVFRKYDGNGPTVTLERETLHVMDDKQRVALVETRTRLVGNDPAPRQLVRYQLGNHLGSAALELDDQAQVISYEEYHPYGTTAYEAAGNNTETPKRYRYTGKERDEETGFTYHGARYYAPWLSRWISTDPIGIEGGLNVYGYVNARPVNFTDPLGLDKEAGEALPGGPGYERTVPGKGGFYVETAEDVEERRVKEVRERAEENAKASFDSIQNASHLNDIHWRDPFDDSTSLIEGFGSAVKTIQDPSLIPVPEDTTNVELVGDTWQPKLFLDERFLNDPEYQKTFLRKFDDEVGNYLENLAHPPLQAGVGAPRGRAPLPRVRTYSGSKGLPGGQSHHLNQDAAFRELIPKSQGASVKLPGNAFTEKGTGHFEFHKALEEFWDQYRSGPKIGQRPTVLEYNEALHNALLKAGVKAEVAKFYADVARRQLTLFHGVKPTDPVPRVPGRLNQKK